MSLDEDLLTRAQQFEPEALQTLHRQLYQPVYRYIYLKIGDANASQDLTSDVFLRMLEALKGGRGWQTTPNAWIFGIARNVVADHYRRRERRPEVELDENALPAADPGLAQTVIAAEEQTALLAAMEELTDEQRDVVFLRFMEGLSIKDVAEVMGKTEGAIKALQFRSMQALSKIMQQKGGDA
jgi:RNA polymerase sigma-70 factor (ECF subfamily)